MPKVLSKQVPLGGTEKKPLAGARVLGQINPQQHIAVTLMVRPCKSLPIQRPGFRELLTLPIAQRQYLSCEELASRHGADSADMDKVEAFAHEHELTVVHRSLSERRLVLSGTLESLTQAFGVKSAYVFDAP